jgi:hypothetical protein
VTLLPRRSRRESFAAHYLAGIGAGHALTIDVAQAITSGEHIKALPRGTGGITAFKAYTAESRHVTQVWTMISEAADMSEKPCKTLAIDLLHALRRDHETVVDQFIRSDLRLQTQRAAGRQPRRAIHARLSSDTVRKALVGQIEALSEVIVRDSDAVMEVAEGVLNHFVALRDSMERAKQRIDRAAVARPEPDGLRPSSSLSPGF